MIGIKSTKQNLNVRAIFISNITLKKQIINYSYNNQAKHVDQGSTKHIKLRQAIRQTECNFQSTGKTTYWPADPKKTPVLLDLLTARKVSSNFIDVEKNCDIHSDRSTVTSTQSEKKIWKEEELSSEDQNDDHRKKEDQKKMVVIEEFIR